MGDYYCPECKNTFDEPRRYVEMHGFTYGPGEHWAVCPYCGNPGWGDTVYCAECDEPHLADELTEGLCEACYAEAEAEVDEEEDTEH